MLYFPSGSIAAAAISFGIVSFTSVTVLTKGIVVGHELQAYCLIGLFTIIGVGCALHAICASILHKK